MPGASTLNAVCIRCGTFKAYARDKCPNCGFRPDTNTDLAKSFVLSAAFDVGDKTIGRPKSELTHIAQSIAQGVPYQFSAPELEAVECEVEKFRAIKPRHLAIDLLKWLGPPAIILAIVYALLWAT